MRLASCLSCGAEVTFRSSATLMAVCGHCRATLVRRDAEAVLENLGQMAELAQDASPLHLGWQGRYQNVGFELVGRLQLRYPQGGWNEWYALFADGREGWLSEGSGLAYLTFPTPTRTAIPAFEQLSLGQALRIGGRGYTVSNRETAHCIAVVGELPFVATPGWAAPAVDLRGEGEQFASLDFSSDPPGFYTGQVVDLAQLARNPNAVSATEPERIKARLFKCSQCGAPITVSLAATCAVGCGHCGSVVDVQDPNLALLSRARERMPISPRLQPGSEGTLHGASFTVLGFMRRSCPLAVGHWDEYLLYNPKQGFRWLIENQGHWSFGRACASLPEAKLSNLRGKTATYLGQTYRHYQQYPAQVDHVLGEFNWQVRVGDTATVDDYLHPPQMLSREETASELSWTVVEYLPADELQAAFKPEPPLPEPQGIAPNQPSPYAGRVAVYWVLFGLALLAALVVQMVFSLSGSSVAMSQTLNLEPGADKGHFVSAPFRVGGASGNLVLINDTNLHNQWLALEMTLTERSTGQQFVLNRELGFYSGEDSDGTWEEGARRDEAVLSQVPAGEYILEVELESGAEGQRPISSRLRVERNRTVWNNFWVLALVLLVWPVVVTLRSQQFETRRWAESDTAQATTDGD